MATKALKNNWYSWTTLNELHFIGKLGLFAKTNRADYVSPKQLLLNYRDTIDTRDDWGAMDKEVIRVAVDAMLDRSGGLPHPTDAEGTHG